MRFSAPDMASELEISRKIEADRIRARLICSRSHLILLMSIACSLLVLYVFWPLADHSLLLGWTMLVWLGATVTYGMTLRLRSSHDCKGSPGRCLNYLLIGTLLTSVVFGAAGWIFIAHGELLHQTLLTILLWGMSAVTLTAYSASLRLYSAYNLPISLPVMLMHLVQSGEAHMIIGTIGVFLVGILELSAWWICRSISDSIELQIDNRDLVKELAQEVAIRKQAESTVRSRDDNQLERESI